MTDPTLYNRLTAIVRELIDAGITREQALQTANAERALAIRALDEFRAAAHAFEDERDEARAALEEMKLKFAETIELVAKGGPVHVALFETNVALRTELDEARAALVSLRRSLEDIATGCYDAPTTAADIARAALLTTTPTEEVNEEERR